MVRHHHKVTTETVELKGTEVITTGSPAPWRSVVPLTVGDRIFVLPLEGEESDEDVPIIPTKIFWIDTREWKWHQEEALGEIPPREAVAAVSWRSQIFYFCSSSQKLFDVFILETGNFSSSSPKETMTWRHPSLRGLSPRGCHDGLKGFSVALMDCHILLFGGGCNDRDDRFDDLHVLNTGRKSFQSSRRNIGVARGNHNERFNAIPASVSLNGCGRQTIVSLWWRGQWRE